ncbi:cupin domain-containing protein [Chitinophaga silvatica]|uniref:Cupin domain-containing protein n=1 Tax=Chitinophaga silvatica TaxID=2282649 RepID=A0A3E1YHA6_9BACT|nr:cupin domain-containing protein [Chitinophaga silvatica]RFS26738.1 cupin domain-containing protein [Chitinophaga silvatica]
MRRIFLYLSLPVWVVYGACNDGNQNRNIVHKELGLSLVFPTGDLITNDNFTGTAYLYSLVEGDSINGNSVGNVTFEPGARSKWHLHPAGQILLAIDGVGYYQEKGKTKVILRKGVAIKCPPNILHWHGASIDSPFVQIAITGREKGPTQWFDTVSEGEYNSAPTH